MTFQHPPASPPAAARMARDMSDKEILKMELDQLKKEVSTPRSSVSCLHCSYSSRTKPLASGRVQLTSSRTHWESDDGVCDHRSAPSDQQVASNCADTISFVENLAPNDPLIKGVPDDKNPYKGDKGGCIIT